MFAQAVFERMLQALTTCRTAGVEGGSSSDGAGVVGADRPDTFRRPPAGASPAGSGTISVSEAADAHRLKAPLHRPMPESMFNAFDTQDGVRVLELRLPFTMDILTFDDLNNLINQEIEATPADYVVDMTGTSYVGSAVLGLLLNVRSRIRRAGGRLVLCQLSPRILEIFRTGSLESLFTIVSTRQQAMDTLLR